MNSVRWLALFRRPLRLHVHEARRVLAVAPAAGPASNLVAGGAPPRPFDCGTVGLSGMLLRDTPRTAAPSSAPPAPATDDAPRRSGRDGPRSPRAPAEPEVSLARRLAVRLRLPTALLLAPAGPLQWPAALFEYQLDGVRALLERDALLLADDMGLGKTIQAIAALRLLVVQRRVESALVVVPAGLVSQWRQELHRWAPELHISTVRGPARERSWQWEAPAHVYLTSYETLRSDATDNPRSPPRRRTWDVVVLDEGQRIKNRDTDISRRCKQLRRRRAWVLTGTPLENAEDDLASVLEMVAPRGDADVPATLAPGAALRARQATRQLRRRKRDVLRQLPPKLVNRIVLPLEGAQRESYDRAEREGVMRLRASGEAVRIEHVLELITRLKQIANFCPVSGRSAKLDDMRERLATLEAEGHRALIFSQFTDATFGGRAIAAALPRLRPLLYTGDLSAPQRDAVIREFRADPERRALVLSVRAGGQGLNLQDASYVFHFDRWWNPAVERQAEDRAHRLGQRVPVHVYSYTLEGTIEERIDRILREKQLLFDELVDDVSIDLTARLTGEELFGLFGLTPPARA